LCSNNENLETLEGAPKYVDGNFIFKNNKGKFTEEEIRAVCEIKGWVYLK
jgi:hypothetical protein